MNQVERRKKQMAYIADQECGEEMNACKRILHELNTVAVSYTHLTLPTIRLV